MGKTNNALQKFPRFRFGNGGVGCIYLWSALRKTGTIRSATAPPMRAVISWGQLKVAGRAFSMGAFIAPLASRLSDRTPQISQTTIAYRAANLAAAAASQAMICLAIFLPDLSASRESNTTNTELPTMMAGTVRIWGAMPSRKASTGLISATVNFTVNRNVVFKGNERLGKALLKYALLAAAVLGLNLLLMHLLTLRLGWPIPLAKIVVEVLLFCMNFVVQGKFVYRKQSSGKG